MHLHRIIRGALAVSGGLLIAGAAGAQVVSLDPATAAAPDAGKTITFTLKVADIQNLFGWQADVVYDKAVLKFAKFEEGGFLKSLGASFSTPPKEKDVAGDPDGLNRSVTLAATLLLPGASAKGSGDLGVLTFDVVAKRATLLKVSGAKFLDPTPKEMPVTTKGATLTVEAANKPPKAAAGQNQNASVGASVAFDGSASSDEDGTIAKFEWDFGDGSKGEGAKVTHIYATAGTFSVSLTVTDDKGATAKATVTVTVSGKPIVREHASASPALRLTATFPVADQHGHAYIAIWKGEWPVKQGQWLEYQVAMFSGNPAFQASVDASTADGATLRDIQLAGKPVVDQNGVGSHPANDLSKFARDKWYHRQIPLDALAGKTVTEVTLAVDSDKHAAGVFNAWFDNIQVTDKTNLIAELYTDGKEVPLPTPVAVATAAGQGGIQGMTDASVTAGTTSVAVHPRGKLVTTWGILKRR
jgi:PKD repeat protein